MKTLIKIFSGLLFLCLAACSGRIVDNNSTVEETPLQMSNQEVQLIFSINTNGGCMMMGPNCPHYDLMSDGSFNVLRKTGGEIANSGAVEKQLVEQWIQATDKTNFKVLLANLGKGECRACYDGVDISYTVLPASKNISFSSTEYQFSNTEEFFIVSEMLHKAMRTAAPLGVQSR